MQQDLLLWWGKGRGDSKDVWNLWSIKCSFLERGEAFKCETSTFTYCWVLKSSLTYPG